MKRIPRAVLLAAVLISASNANTILTLNPRDGALFGQPGDTVGWGFTIVNDTYTLTVAGTDFCSSFDTSAPGAFPCNNPVPDGTYLDFTMFNFVQSQPGMADTSQQNFSPCSTSGSCTGAGSFTINPDNALIGTPPLKGVIVVDYNLNDGMGDHFATADASVQVIPEPGTLFPAAIALAVVFLLWRRACARNEAV
jgi:hypothetical protein